MISGWVQGWAIERPDAARLDPEVVDDIVASVEPARIILFGSAARDELGPGSNLDLLVVLDELDPADRAKLMGEIRFAIRAPVPSTSSSPMWRSANGAGMWSGRCTIGRFARARWSIATTRTLVASPTADTYGIGYSRPGGR